MTSESLQDKHKQVKTTSIFEAFLKTEKQFKMKWFSIWSKIIHLYLIIFMKSVSDIFYLLGLVWFGLVWLGVLLAVQGDLESLSSHLVTWTLARFVDVHYQSRLHLYLNGSLLKLCSVNGVRPSAVTQFIVDRKEKWLTKQGDLSVMVYIHNPSTHKVEAGRLSF